MTTRAKQATGLALGFMAGYLVLLPFFWPEPRVSAIVPARARMNDVLQIEVAAHAWHRNLDITQVRFYVDYTATTAKGPNGIFYPELILERSGTSFRGLFRRNPLTCPYTQRMPAQFDLSRFASQGILGPGQLIGKLDITFNYVPARPGKNFNYDPTRTMTKSVPFDITIQE